MVRMIVYIASRRGKNELGEKIKIVNINKALKGVVLRSEEKWDN